MRNASSSGRADPAGLSDTAPHRSDLAGAYNRYVRCAADPVYRADREAQQIRYDLDGPILTLTLLALASRPLTSS